MKNFFAFLIGLLLLQFMKTHSQEVTKVKGGFKMCTTYFQMYFDGETDTKNKSSVYYFDDNGYLTHQINEKEKNDLITEEKETYKHDDAGNIYEITYSNRQNETWVVTSKKVNTFNESGKLAIITTYDTNGSVTSKRDFSATLKEDSIFVAKNTVVKTNSKGIKTKVYRNGESTRTTIYDIDGNKTEETYQSKKGAKLTKDIYKYDIFGNLSEKKSYSGNELLNTVYYIYSKDTLPMPKVLK